MILYRIEHTTTKHGPLYDPKGHESLYIARGSQRIQRDLPGWRDLPDGKPRHKQEVYAFGSLDALWCYFGEALPIFDACGYVAVAYDHPDPRPVHTETSQFIFDRTRASPLRTARPIFLADLPLPDTPGVTGIP